MYHGLRSHKPRFLRAHVLMKRPGDTRFYWYMVVR